MSSLPKRLKIAEDATSITTSTQIHCEYCGFEIRRGDQWDHIARHQQGLEQLEKMNYEFDSDKVLLPWYMHSIYQDRSVNRSRFEVIQFTELTQDSPFLAFEKLITKPFSTHFWLNFKAEKSDDVVKNYFGLKPETVSYQISDYQMSHGGTMRYESGLYYFECCLCEKRVKRCATLPQTLMSILIHALTAHNKNTEVYNAALQDIMAIQESTGIQTHLKAAPNYNPLMASDLVFDMLHSEHFYLYTGGRIAAIMPTYCLLCFKICEHIQANTLNPQHMKPAHKLDVKYTNTKFAGITTSRYGHSVAIARKHHLDYLVIVFNQALKEFSWACIICECTLKHEDSTQLMVHVMAHLSKNVGGCEKEYMELFPFMLKHSLFMSTIRELFSPVSQCRSEIVSWDSPFLDPLECSDVLDAFLSTSFKKFLELAFPITDKTIGLVQLCEAMYKKKESSRLNDKNLFIHICPFCFQYFLESAQVFLHMRPGECSEMRNFIIRLNAADLEKALENVN